MEQYVRLLIWDDCSVHGYLTRYNGFTLFTCSRSGRSSSAFDTIIEAAEVTETAMNVQRGPPRRVRPGPHFERSDGVVLTKSKLEHRIIHTSKTPPHMVRPVRKIVAHQITASHLNTLTDTFPATCA